MKDTIIKGNGKSRNIKAPADMPETFEDWRTQLLAGTATLDIGLNAAGCDVVGTPISKANLLSDTTKVALGLTGDDSTVNDALYALSQTGPFSELHIWADVGTTVTMTKSGKTLTGTVAADHYAVLYPRELGDWTMVYVWEGVQKTKVYTMDAIAIEYIYPFVMGDTLDTTSWEGIAAFSKFGLASTRWAVGDIKKFVMNGSTYSAQIIGFDHDTLTTPDGSRTKAGITFQLEKCYSASYAMNDMDENTNGWSGSKMRTSTMSTLLGLLPDDLASVLKFVNKITSKGKSQSTLETTSDKLFLPSEVEVFGSNAYSYSGEGVQYAYYLAGNSKQKYSNDSPNGNTRIWWLRSPEVNDNTRFCIVDAFGDSTIHLAGDNQKVAFAFCV